MFYCFLKNFIENVNKHIVCYTIKIFKLSIIFLAGKIYFNQEPNKGSTKYCIESMKYRGIHYDHPFCIF